MLITRGSDFQGCVVGFSVGNKEGFRIGDGLGICDGNLDGMSVLACKVGLGDGIKLGFAMTDISFILFPWKALMLS